MSTGICVVVDIYYYILRIRLSLLFFEVILVNQHLFFAFVQVGITEHAIDDAIEKLLARGYVTDMLKILSFVDLLQVHGISLNNYSPILCKI